MTNGDSGYKNYYREDVPPGIAQDCSESTGTAGSLTVMRICDNCDKEFVVRSGIGLSGKPTEIPHHIAVEECPHCKTTNHIWITIIRK